MFKVLCILLLPFSIFANDLFFQKNGKTIQSINVKDLKSGNLKIKNKKLISQDKTLYNAWRSYSRTYRGYDFYELLDTVYGKEWMSAKTITFAATDGYKQIANIKRMLKSAKSKKGMISYTEAGKDGFSHFSRKEKVIDPGPLYLVWSNFSDTDKASHGDNLKWPYQLKSINLKF